MNKALIRLNQKILSIQSHVVSGYVGNKSCVLPLQLLGNEVDYINTVQFSNHTGYKSVIGPVLNSSDMREICNALKANDLFNYSVIISGYIGSKSQLEELGSIVKDIKKSNPNAKYYCDPVLGDDGKMYVPEDLMQIYRDKILALADVVFPNQYEIELLTNSTIKVEDHVIEAMSALHKKGIRTIVITSTNLGPKDLLYGYVSKLNEDGTRETLRLEIPKLPHHFVGTGDLFASLFLGWSIRLPDNLKEVCSKVIGTMQHVLKKTIDKHEALIGAGGNKGCYSLELDLVGCLSDIMDPPSHSGVTVL